MLKTLWVDALSPEQTEAVRAVLLAARAVDGRPDVHADGPLPSEFTGGPHLLGSPDNPVIGDPVIGYGHLDETGDSFGRQIAELFVHPEHRGSGFGTDLFAEIEKRANGPVRFWSHGDHPAAARIADRAGFARVRELLRMHADMTDIQVDPPALPSGVRIRTFRPGADEDAVIEVNSRAFARHPEQGTLTAPDLFAAEKEHWFDPEGFFLAIDRGGDLLGFHWTKVHPPAPDPATDPLGGASVGEVYVVGVDPRAQGGGVGKAVTVAGLAHLRTRGLRHVILYVEGDNDPAISVYTRLGFRTQTTDVQYERR